MEEETAEKKPDDLTLRIQLQELNQRSRLYASQFWQVPFAYFAIIGVALSSRKLIYSQPIAFVAALLGILVLWHMGVVLNNCSTAVRKLQKVEEGLHFPEKARARNVWTDDIPLFAAVIIVVIALLHVAFGCCH